ncbi:hypothetical protein [Aquamicrobium sp.]|uniref:hypothetical protein n=1 Tax=Aquamicrobium sp. TaxID=1872579 RepID=UPI002585BF31|nr:hypothetical protein [Aquamicrobium sp.]MCK9549246.1 hypothetical protein [Aquamicrobium sp.]
MRHIRFSLRSTLVAAFALIAIPAAHAQDNGGSGFDLALPKMMLDGLGVPANQNNADDTVVGADPMVSAQAKMVFVEHVRANKGDAVARSIDDWFTQNPVRTVFARVGEPYGLSPQSYPDVMAAWMVSMWLTANNAPQLPSQTQVDGVRRQVRATIEQKGITGTTSERQLQAESMMYEVVSAIGARQEAEQAGDRTALESLAASTQSNLQQRGLNFQALALGDSGLQPR